MLAVTPSKEIAIIPRNLIICCDGTNNEFGPENTNVVRLIQVLDRDPTRQLLYYDPGLGTLPEPGAFSTVAKWLSEIGGLAFGAGLSWKVLEAYAYLMEYWEPGDQVFLFGFSRGSYTVRVLAGLLHALGLLPRGGSNLLPYLMRLFKSIRKPANAAGGSTRDYWALCDDFRRTFARAVPGHEEDRRFPVHFLGVWDTVSSVGWVWDPASFPFTVCNPGVGVVRHAVSIDERRSFFRQNLFTPYVDPASQKSQDFKQYWFAGVHSDVGGGYPTADGNLWQVAMEWMLDEAVAAGLFTDSTARGTVLTSHADAPPPWKDLKHESLTLRWWGAEFFPKLAHKMGSSSRVPRINRGRPRFIPTGAPIYRSVLQRIRGSYGQYRPPNLPARFVDKILALPEPLPETLPFEW